MAKKIVQDYVLWATDPSNIGEGDLCLKEGVEGQLRLLELLLLLPDPALLHLHHAQTQTEIPATRV